MNVSGLPHTDDVMDFIYTLVLSVLQDSLTGSLANTFILNQLFGITLT